MAEIDLQDARGALDHPDNVTDYKRMQGCLKLVAEKQTKVDEFYRIWESLEQKLKQST